MQTLIIIILILVLLTATGYFGHRANGVRGVIIALVIALLVLAVVGFFSDEFAIGPGVAPIMEAPK
ncbi:MULTISPECIES: hypothetical protein [Ancylobacter]|uniref:FtsH-binding integral membrane protein n=2 Tax=Ancylobacter TaxID=99 RepID=A0A839ZAJ4_9HYPH|nr:MULTISPECIES: hypothetical protein [Ancylobacter]MBB3771781.1 FtsH-binding integral membrane protein [Ancylobacter tetraedralis]MDQ0512851.1 FtsH-binding integral membrane protein [Ancylobacter amanitiformis]